MNERLLIGIGVAVVVLAALAAASIPIVPEYERGVVFWAG